MNTLFRMEYRVYTAWICVMYSLYIEGSDAVCSLSQRAANLEACLNAITSAFENRDLFWFGASYPQECPFDAAVSINCYNSRGLSGDSLSSAVFPQGGFSTDTVDRFLQVSYTSPPGEYTGCGHKYRFESETTVEVDPLSDDVIKAWDARDLPEVTWTADASKQYTLIIQDPASGRLHLFLTDIQGNDVANGHVSRSYHGPLPTKTVRNPYVFLLFEQQINDINVAPDDDFQRVYSITTVIQTLRLIGPKAITWVSVEFDPYAAETLRQSDTLENCSPFVTEALEDEDVQFQDLNLDVPLPGYAEVSITPTETFNFSFCCQQYSYPLETVVLDPIGGVVLSPAVARSEATINIRLSQTGLFPNRTRDFRDKLFTVAMVDPDIPAMFSSLGDQTLPLLHWLSYNMAVPPDGVLAGGTVDKAYMGPMPRDEAVHAYYVMVYEQAGSQTLALDSAQYSGDSCPERNADRCRFNVTSMVSNNNLELFAASWLNAQNDDFGNFRNNVNQSASCVGRPGYREPCDRPTTATPSGASYLAPYLLVMISGVCLVLLC